MSLLVDIKSKLDNFEMDISLQTKAKRIGILGASGTGKSMLLKYISGIVSPDEGVIKLNENTIFDSSEKINIRPQKRNVAYMFQNYALFPNMTVKENIEIIIDAGKEYKKNKASKLMEKFCIDDIADKKPKELSGGQQQRVALARIMAYEPKLILLDEPFSALDNDLKERLQMELEDMIADYDGMIIMVSHSKDEIYRFSDELIILNDGRLVEHGMTKKVFDKPRTVLGAKMVGVSNILPAYVDKESSIQIPELDISISENKFDEVPKDAISYVGIRDIDFKILESDAVDENFIDAKIEKIYDGIEYIKVFFSVKGIEDKLSDESDKVYCLRLNKFEDGVNLVKNSSLKLVVDKEKIIHIEA